MVSLVQGIVSQLLHTCTIIILDLFPFLNPSVKGNLKPQSDVASHKDRLKADILVADNLRSSYKAMKTSLIFLTSEFILNYLFIETMLFHVFNKNLIVYMNPLTQHMNRVLS